MSGYLIRRARELAALALTGGAVQAWRPGDIRIHPTADKFRAGSDEQLAALLQDAVASGSWTREDLLAMGFPPRVLDAAFAQVAVIAPAAPIASLITDPIADLPADLCVLAPERAVNTAGTPIAGGMA